MISQRLQKVSCILTLIFWPAFLLLCRVNGKKQVVLFSANSKMCPKAGVLRRDDKRMSTPTVEAQQGGPIDVRLIEFNPYMRPFKRVLDLIGLSKGGLRDRSNSMFLVSLKSEQFKS